jgi:cell division transport system permease protein
MNIFFSLSEGIRSLFKARLATTVSVISVMFTLILLGLFFLFYLNLNQWIHSIRNKIGLEVFLSDTITDEQIRALKSTIQKIDGVSAIKYVSKKDASIRFKEEFGYEINEVLSYNPLPPSFILELKEDYKNAIEIGKLSQKLKKIPRVDDVVYQELVINLIDKYVQIILMGIAIVGLIIIIITNALIFNTIRLTIFARRDIIQIMRLVGATTGFIKRPFIIEGIIQGVIGAAFASLFLFGMIYIIKNILIKQIMIDPQIFILLFSVGIIIGWISANMSVHKYLHRV